MASCSGASAGHAARRLACLLLGLLSAWATNAVAEQAPRTVLLLYGEASMLPGNGAIDDEIRTGLSMAVGPTQFYIEHLDDAWFPSPGVQRAIVDVLRRKYSGRKLDLVIVVAPGALQFALSHRAALFGGAPVVFVSRRAGATPALPADVTGTWFSIDWRANLDLILRLQPDTKRVAVVYGTSAFDRNETGKIRDAFAAYRGRLELIELTDLPFADLLKKVAALPDRTVILFYVLLRDGAGANHVPTHALAAIARATRVAVYGVSDTFIGHGIVGGRVISFREHGRQAAALAARALRGESPGPPGAGDLDLNVTTFDAHALKRWEISETRLPPGSVVVNGNPSVWKLYRWYVVGGLAVGGVEALLIAGLLVQRRRHALTQQALALSLRFERLVAETSTTLAATPLDDVEAAVQTALSRIVEELQCDRASLFEFTDDRRLVRVGLSIAAPGVVPLPTTMQAERYPWTLGTLRRGDVVRFRSPEQLPDDAAIDRATFQELGTRSLVCLPLEVGHVIVGGISLVTVRAERDWSDALIPRLRLLGDIFASSLVRRRASNAIWESEARFRLAADSAPIMMWMASPDGGSTYVNRGWLDFTGRKMEEELGDGWTTGVHPDDRKDCLDRYRRALDARESFTIEYRLRRRDGAYRWVLDHGVPRFTRDGAFSGYVGECTDVTEIKAAHATLLESLALRSAIFSSLYGHVAALDKDGVVAAVNASWTEFAAGGWNTPRPPVGANYLEACERAGHVGAGAMANAVRAVLDGEHPRATLEYAARSGTEERWFEMAVEPFQRPEGGAIVSHVDITRRRRAEAEARRQRDELAHALRASTLGALAGSLAHEINQPLAAIAANAQAARLLLSAGGREQHELREALMDIADDAKRAAQVIRRLRALFRKEREEYKPADINALIVDVMMLLRSELESKGIGVQLSLAKDLPPVLGDAIQLQQVLLNVLLNAVEAAADRSTGRALVTIETVERHPGAVEIAVRDDGPGVKEADLERIFEPFVTTKSTGLGMGLSISRSIVQAHGGRMWATRTDPQGLTVHVELSH